MLSIKFSYKLESYIIFEIVASVHIHSSTLIINAANHNHVIPHVICIMWIFGKQVCYMHVHKRKVQSGSTTVVSQNFMLCMLPMLIQYNYFIITAGVIGNNFYQRSLLHSVLVQNATINWSKT